MIQGNVAAARAAVHGIDCNTKLDAAKAKALVDQGFTFAIRYLSRGTVEAAGDLDVAELSTILASGLAAMPVQHVASEGWRPTAALGRTNGANAAAHAAAAGFPKGVNVWLDLEGVQGGIAPSAVIDYCNEWHGQVADAGYLPGIYVGANCGLNGAQLYWQLQMKYYWRAGSRVPDIPVRGYCMVQTIIVGDKVGGIAIDRNVITPDAFGLTPIWTTLTAPAPAQPQAVLPGTPLGQAEQVLVRLAQEKGVAGPMKRMIEYRTRFRPDAHPRHWAVVNFDLHSAKPRLFLFDTVAETATGYLCAHGRGSEGPKDDGFAEVFSNIDGSNCSSLGIYRCAETYFGDHGKSLRLDGMEAMNSNARHRVIVIHGADYVSPETIAETKRIGRSLGCPAVENRFAPEIVDALANGSLMIIAKTGA